MALQIRDVCQVTSEFGFEMTVRDESPVCFERVNIFFQYLDIVTASEWQI